MRELTFKGFLGQYVRQLSFSNTNSLYKLAEEASERNPRLKEPLLLYSLYSGKEKVLLQAAKDKSLRLYYDSFLSQYTAEDVSEMLASGSRTLQEEYHKVWRSYMSLKNRSKVDDNTKELIRKKVKQLQEQSGITNYRIYTDLKLNPGNLNAWLKYGDGGKVSLDTARMTLQYVQQRM